MSGGWDQALDAMTDLVHSFKTKEGEIFMQGVTDSIHQQGLVYDRKQGKLRPRDEAVPPEDTEELIRAAKYTVEAADPIWVSAEVSELIEYAASRDTFKAVPLYLDDLLIPHGFALFESPLMVTDIKGATLPFRGFSWAVASGHKEGDTATAYDLAGRGPESGIVCALWTDARDSWPSEVRRHTIGGSYLTLAHVNVLHFGDDSMLAERTNNELLRKLETFWRLAKQEVAWIGPERASRPSWKRASSWRQIKDVTVMRLRKVRQPKYEGEEREVEWSHRWTVRGHWRNQPYKINGQWETRQIWIEEYVKGPDDKPFVAKRHAIEFTR